MSEDNSGDKLKLKEKFIICVINLLDNVSNILKSNLFVGLLGLITLIASFVFIFDWYIQMKIENPQYIGKIATLVHPYIIFDSNGVIQVDAGGMNYIEKIETSNINLNVPKNIFVKLKEYIKNEPYIICLGGAIVQYDVQRTEGINFIINVHSSYVQNIGKPLLFRMDIIKN